MADDIGQDTRPGHKVQRRCQIAAGGDADKTQGRPYGVLRGNRHGRAGLKAKRVKPAGNAPRGVVRCLPGHGVTRVGGCQPDIGPGFVCVLRQLRCDACRGNSCHWPYSSQ